MKSTPKKKTETELLGLTKGISRIYRVLLLLQEQLSQWRPQAGALFSKYDRTRDPRDLKAFAFHITGELKRVRESLRGVGQ